MRHIVIAPSLYEARQHAAAHNIPAHACDLFSVRSRGFVRGMRGQGVVIHPVRPDLWPAQAHTVLAPLLADGATYA